jgi:hypothetical protein
MPTMRWAIGPETTRSLLMTAWMLDAMASTAESFRT